MGTRIYFGRKSRHRIAERAAQREFSAAVKREIEPMAKKRQIHWCPDCDERFDTATESIDHFVRQHCCKESIPYPEGTPTAYREHYYSFEGLAFKNPDSLVITIRSLMGRDGLTSLGEWTLAIRLGV